MNFKQSRLKAEMLKKLFKRVFFLLLGLILISCIAAVIFSYILLPVIIRGEIERKVSSLTGGSTKIENIKAGYFSPFIIEGLTGFGPEKKQLLSMQKAKAVMVNWPGLRPSISELEIDGLSLHGHMENGKFSFPKAISSDSKSSSKDLGVFHKLQIRDISIDLAGESKSKNIV